MGGQIIEPLVPVDRLGEVVEAFRMEWGISRRLKKILHYLFAAANISPWKACIGSIAHAHGIEYERPRPRPPIPWGRVLLWCVLGAVSLANCVLVLAFSLAIAAVLLGFAPGHSFAGRFVSRLLDLLLPPTSGPADELLQLTAE